MSKKKNPILAFVGSSGVGKTTLMMELLKRIPEKVFPIVTTTTRNWRGPEDDVFCKFVSREHIQELKKDGKLAQYLEYAGNTYGCEWVDIDWAVENGFGIQAYVEPAIYDLRNAGYEVIPIKIVADQVNFRDEKKREEEDKERAKIQLDYVLTIENSFIEGGLEKAVQKLLAFIEDGISE
ncbi:MAG: hypothetical protein ACRCZE_03825 [Candidatus Altimarinota bacterium]